MSLLELPEEILTTIIRQLDMQTIYNLYCTCRRMRSKMRARGVLKHLNFTLNKQAHVKYLKSSLFKLSHLKELTLAGVDDLQQSCFLPALKHLKRLSTIDVSYTMVDLLYFNEIYSVCPKIKNATLNFVSKATPNNNREYSEIEVFEAKLSVEQVQQCQKTFKKMVNLHFVGSSENLLKQETPIIFLNGSNLNTLKFTIIDNITKTPTIVCPTECSDNMKKMKLDDKIKLIKFKSFFINSLKLKETSLFDSINTSPIIREISESSVEKLFVVETCHHTERKYRNYCLKPSSIFESHLIDTKLHFVEPNMLKPLYAPSHALIMFWNKDHHTFDDAFFNKLLKSLNYAFPHDCAPYLPSSTPVPTSNNWFCLKPIDPQNNDSGPSEPKRSYLDPSINLHYDDIFRTKSSLELSFILGDLFEPVFLSEKSNYLKKLTHLDLNFSISGKASPNFFKILYECCINLATLNIKAPSPPAKRDVLADRTPFSVGVSKGLHKAKRLKNFKLDDKYIEFNMIYKGLAECTELEKVVLLDYKYDLANVGDFEILFTKPKPKMYMLTISSYFTRPSYARLMNRFLSLNLKGVQYRMYEIPITSYTQYFNTEFPFELRRRHLEM